MQYMGGKSRIARYIAEIINNTLNGGGERSMRYQGGKSRIATPLAQILNATGGGAFNEIPRRQEPYSNTFGADPQRYGGGLALLAFSVVAAPLKAKLLAMTALY